MHETRSCRANDMASDDGRGQEQIGRQRVEWRGGVKVSTRERSAVGRFGAHASRY